MNDFKDARAKGKGTRGKPAHTDEPPFSLTPYPFSNTHFRYRSRPAHHRLRRVGQSRAAVELCRQRLHQNSGRRIAGTVKSHIEFVGRSDRAAPARSSRGGKSVRQRQSAIHPAARSGARRGDLRGGAGESAGSGIHRVAGETSRGRQRPCREGASATNGATLVEIVRHPQPGCGRRTGLRDLSCARRTRLGCVGYGGVPHEKWETCLMNIYAAVVPKIFWPGTRKATVRI